MFINFILTHFMFLFSLYKKLKNLLKLFSLWKKCFLVSRSVSQRQYRWESNYLYEIITVWLLFCVVCSEWQLTPQWIAPRRPSYLFQWQMKQMKSVSSVIEKTFLSVNCKKQCFVKVQFSHSVSQRQYWWDFLFFRIAFNVLLGNRPCRSFYSGKKGDCIVI